MGSPGSGSGPPGQGATLSAPSVLSTEEAVLWLLPPSQQGARLSGRHRHMDINNVGFFKGRNRNHSFILL